MAKSRRRHTRAKARNLVAHIHIGDATVLAPVEDISSGGAFLKTVEHIAVGRLLPLDIARPGLKRPLRVVGQVVEARPGRGIGVQFHGLDNEAHERLRIIVTELGAPSSGDTITLPPVTLPPDALTPLAPPTLPLDALTPLPVASAPLGTAWTLNAPPPQVPWANLARASSAPPAPVPSTPLAPVGLGAVPPGASPQQTAEELARVVSQLRGAIMQMSEVQQQLAARDRELAEARTRIAELESTMGDAVERLRGGLRR